MQPAERQRVRRLANSAGVAICCLDSSVRVATGEASIADDLVANLEFASDLEAPLLRVFPGPWPAGSSREEVILAIAGVIGQVTPVAERLGVAMVLETHDSFSSALLVGELLQRIPQHSFGTIWDIFQPYLQGESVDQAFDALAGRVLHVHVKDARKVDGSTELVPMGTGEIPVREIMGRLLETGYDGYFALEWPKLWHPELADPEEVLPQHATVLRQWLATDSR
jgi:sugar phosphate isomerase/epimerase